MTIQQAYEFLISAHHYVLVRDEADALKIFVELRMELVVDGAEPHLVPVDRHMALLDRHRFVARLEKRCAA